MKWKTSFLCNKAKTKYYGSIFTKSSLSFPSRHFSSKKTDIKPKKVNLKLDDVRTKITDFGKVPTICYVPDSGVSLGGFSECCPEELANIFHSQIEVSLLLEEMQKVKS